MPPCRRVIVVVGVMMMGVALAMMVMTMVMVMIVVVLVVVMGVTMVRVIVIARRHRGADGGGAMERVQERQERPPLHPQQSHADDDDERVADDFDHVDRAAHGRAGRV